MLRYIHCGSEEYNLCYQEDKPLCNSPNETTTGTYINFWSKIICCPINCHPSSTIRKRWFKVRARYKAKGWFNQSSSFWIVYQVCSIGNFNLRILHCHPICCPLHLTTVSPPLAASLIYGTLLVSTKENPNVDSSHYLMFHWIDGRTFTLMRLQFCLNVIHNFLKYFLVPYSSMGYKHLKYGILISNWQHILFCLWVDSVFNYYKA